MLQKVIIELERISKLTAKEVFNIVDTAKYNNSALKKRIIYSTNDIGYKLRPYLVIKGAAIGGVDESLSIPFAIGVELLQLSTLVIDDILDESNKRNNVETCFKKFGTKDAILIGEYLQNLSFRYILSIDNGISAQKLIDAILLLSDAYQAITIGQFYDLQSSSFSKPLTEEESLNLINLTTGIFIKNSLLIGAAIGCTHKEILKSLSAYGYYLGIAYQLRDDIIDIIGAENLTGKPNLIDIENGRLRMPIIYFLSNGSSSQQKAFKKIINKKKKSKEDKFEIAKILIESSAIAYSIKKTTELCEKAKCHISPLPESSIKNELLELPDIIANFDY